MNSAYICYCMAQGRRKWMFVWESEKVLEPWGLSRKEVMGFSAHGKEWDTEERADSLIFQAGCRHVSGHTAGKDGVLLFLCFYCVSSCLLTHKQWFPPALWLTPPFKSSYSVFLTQAWRGCETWQPAPGSPEWISRLPSVVCVSCLEMVQICKKETQIVILCLFVNMASQFRKCF